MVTILGHNSLVRDFPNIQALGCAQGGIPGRYFLMVLPLLIKMEFEVHDQLFHCWSEIFPLKRHSYDLTGGQAWLWVSISVPECTWMSRVGRAIFRIKSYEKPFYVAAAVKPLVYVFFLPSGRCDTGPRWL